MKFFLPLSIFLGVVFTTAQVGVNTQNPQGIFHIDGARNNPNSGSPTILQQNDDIVATSTGKLGVGTITPITKVDTRPNPGNVTPGEGPIAFGETVMAASSAGAGAMRYSTLSGGLLEYSNGIVWNTLTSSVQNSIIIATKQTAQSINDSSVVNITQWSESVDLNNDFDPSTGVFTAPRNGNYQVSFSFTLDNITGNYITASWIEAIIALSDGTRRVSSIPVPVQTNVYAGANVSFAVRLNAGQTIRPTIYQRSGSQKSLRITQDGFNNFSVVEL